MQSCRTARSLYIPRAASAKAQGVALRPCETRNERVEALHALLRAWRLTTDATADGRDAQRRTSWSSAVFHGGSTPSSTHGAGQTPHTRGPSEDFSVSSGVLFRSSCVCV